MQRAHYTKLGNLMFSYACQYSTGEYIITYFLRPWAIFSFNKVLFLLDALLIKIIHNYNNVRTILKSKEEIIAPTLLPFSFNYLYYQLCINEQFGAILS